MINIFAALNEMTAEKVCEQYAGQGFAAFKNDLAELSVEKLGPITDEMRRLSREKTYIDTILKAGAQKADALAKPILRQVHEIVGFLRP